MATKRGSSKPPAPATGRVIVSFRNGLYLGQTGKAVRGVPAPGETASALAAKAGKALKKPGISKSAVFGAPVGRGKVYAYSVLPEDPTKLVRESADGTRTVGRIVDGKFRALRAA